MGREEPTTDGSGRETTTVRQKRNVNVSVRDNDEKFNQNVNTQMSMHVHARGGAPSTHMHMTTMANRTLANQNVNNNNNRLTRVIDELRNELQNTKQTYMAIVADLKHQNLHLKNELKNASHRNDITTNRFIAQTQERNLKISNLESKVAVLTQDNAEYSKLLRESTDDFNRDLILDYKQLENDYKEVESELDEVTETLDEYEIKMAEAAKIVDQFERKCALMKPMVEEHPNLMKLIQKQCKEIAKLKAEKTKMMQSKYVVFKPNTPNSSLNSKQSNKKKCQITKVILPSAYVALSDNKKRKKKQSNKQRRKRKKSNKKHQKKHQKSKSDGDLIVNKNGGNDELFVIAEEVGMNSNENMFCTPSYLCKKSPLRPRVRAGSDNAVGYYT